jgi:hypothetical protein
MIAPSVQSAITGAALAPIGLEEKRELAILCRRAWEKLGRPGLVAGGKVGQAFDAWRHQQAMQCVERDGLRQCRHEDFNFIKAHMLRILGASRQADQVDLRAANEPRRQALAKLKAECRDAVAIAKPMDYVRAIARAKFKTTLIESDLSANQIWQLVFSLRSAESRRRQPGPRIRPVGRVASDKGGAR